MGKVQSYKIKTMNLHGGATGSPAWNPKPAAVSPAGWAINKETII